MKALIICEKGLEECEALIIYDLLMRSGIETTLAGPTQNIISSHKLNFKVNEPLGLINPKFYDCLILPGGKEGVLNLENDSSANVIIDSFVKDKKLICAICAAPSLLIKKGLLKDGEFTCYPGFEGDYISTQEKIHIHNNILTSNGLGSAFEFGLKIVEILLGEGNVESLKKTILY